MNIQNPRLVQYECRWSWASRVSVPFALTCTRQEADGRVGWHPGINSINDKGYHSHAHGKPRHASLRDTVLSRRSRKRERGMRCSLDMHLPRLRITYFVCVKCGSNIKSLSLSLSLEKSISSMLSANFIPIFIARYAIHVWRIENSGRDGVLRAREGLFAIPNF